MNARSDHSVRLRQRAARGLGRSVGRALTSLSLLLAAAAVAWPDGAAAQQQSGANDDGVKIGKRSTVSSLVSAEKVEGIAATQYLQMKREAAQQKALAPDDYPALVNLRQISNRIIPFSKRFNPRSEQWKWEVNLIGSKQINAFCMPGGKIAFYTGILNTLKLTNDEIAVVMGHEIAHALLEHGRERVAKETIANGATVAASVLSSLLGYGNLGGQVASGVGQLTLLKYGRDDETEADLVGLDLAARAGYDPRAAVVLWQKMNTASKGQQPPQFLSTHPSHASRIKEIQAHLKEVMPLYARAVGKDLASLPAYQSNVGEPVR